MLAALAHLDGDLIVERPQAGLCAKADGETLDRPTKTTPERCKAMIDGYAHKLRASALGRLCEVSRAPVLAIVARTPLPATI